MTDMAGVNQERRKEADRLYEQYVKPLEPEYSGTYVAVSPKGETLFGATLLEACQKATAIFGPGNFVFKVGEKAVGKWR